MESEDELGRVLARSTIRGRGIMCRLVLGGTDRSTCFARNGFKAEMYRFKPLGWILVGRERVPQIRDGAGCRVWASRTSERGFQIPPKVCRHHLLTEPGEGGLGCVRWLIFIKCTLALPIPLSLVICSKRQPVLRPRKKEIDTKGRVVNKKGRSESGD